MSLLNRDKSITLDLRDERVSDMFDFLFKLNKFLKENSKEPHYVMLNPKQEMLIGCELQGDDYYELGSMDTLMGLIVKRDAKSTRASQKKNEMTPPSSKIGATA